MNPRASELISALALAPHPEGGFFREVHRSAALVQPADGRPERAALTVIYFLLAAGQASCWHRVASDEAWHFLEGAPLELHEAVAGFTAVVTTRLGPYAHDVAAPVHVVRAGRWQAARSTGEYTLVACTVGPGFDFEDFELLRELPGEADALRCAHPALAALL